MFHHKLLKQSTQASNAPVARPDQCGPLFNKKECQFCWLKKPALDVYVQHSRIFFQAFVQIFTIQLRSAKACKQEGFYPFKQSHRSISCDACAVE
jgi:hypothetical protein